MITLNTNFLPVPEIKTDRLKLRRIVEKDVDRLFSMRSNTSIMKFIKRPLAKTPEDALALVRKIDDSLEAGSGITWGISLTQNDQLIGTIGFWRIEVEKFRAEIGYLLDEAYQGKGIMREAIQAAVKHGFEEINLHTIEARVDPANEASLRVLEKAGFEKEGLLRECYFFDGKFEDSVIFSRINPHHKLPNSC